MHPGSGNLPNAGLLFKGEFVKKHPDLANLFIDELESAVNWVKANPKEAGILSAEKMHTTAPEVEFLLKQAKLDFKRSFDVKDELKVYLDVLKKEKVLKTEDIDKTLGLFKW